MSYNQTLSLYDLGYCVESFFINASIYITRNFAKKFSISSLFVAILYVLYQH